MKKIKLIALLLAALTLTAAFTGCGETTDPETTTSGTKQSTSADDTGTTAPAPTQTTAPGTTGTTAPAPTQTTAPETAGTTAPAPAETTIPATTPEAEPETVPEDGPFPLAGTWKVLGNFEEETYSYFIVDEDGNITTSTGEVWTLQTAPEDIRWGESPDLDYGLPWTQAFFFKQYGDSYLLFSRDCTLPINSIPYYYYREEDYADYDVVELTSENITDYLEYEVNCSADTKGGVSDFWYEERPRFKEGLGPISYVCGKIAYTAYYKNVTLDPLTGEITVGEAAEIEPLEGLDRVHFCGAGEIERYANADNYAATEGTEPLEEVWFYKEMTGIDADFIGWVYVPKGWNSSEAG